MATCHRRDRASSPEGQQPSMLATHVDAQEDRPAATYLRTPVTAQQPEQSHAERRMPALTTSKSLDLCSQGSRIHYTIGGNKRRLLLLSKSFSTNSIDLMKLEYLVTHNPTLYDQISPNASQSLDDEHCEGIPAIAVKADTPAGIFDDTTRPRNSDRSGPQLSNGDNTSFKPKQPVDSWCGMPKELLQGCFDSYVEFRPHDRAFANVPIISTAEGGCGNFYPQEGLYKDITNRVLTKYLRDPMSLWDFPVFQFSVETAGRPLTAMAYHLFKKENLFRLLNIKNFIPRFLKFMGDVEESYHPVPYHNRLHAADVLHAMAYLLQQPLVAFNQRHLTESGSQSRSITLLIRQIKDLGAENDGILDPSMLPSGAVGSLKNALTPVQLAACLFAAAVHDCDHPGRTNLFYKKTNHELARLYNDQSILENHHVNATWQLLNKPGNDFLEELETDDYHTFRELVTSLVLATDLARNEIEGNWKDVLEQTGGGGFALQKAENWPRCSLLLSKAIRIADVVGPSKQRSTYLRWTALLYEEFNSQANEEKACGHEVMEFMNPEKRDVPSMQQWFMQTYCLSPLLSYSEAGLLPGPYVLQDPADGGADEDNDSSSSRSDFRSIDRLFCSVIINNVKSNFDYWEQFKNAPGGDKRGGSECADEGDDIDNSISNQPESTAGEDRLEEHEISDRQQT